MYLLSKVIRIVRFSPYLSHPIHTSNGGRYLFFRSRIYTYWFNGFSFLGFCFPCTYQETASTFIWGCYSKTSSRGFIDYIYCRLILMLLFLLWNLLVITRSYYSMSRCVLLHLSCQYHILKRAYLFISFTFLGSVTYNKLSIYLLKIHPCTQAIPIVCLYKACNNNDVF